MSIKYNVIIENFANKNIKLFHKKYKNNWIITEKLIIFSLERIDNLLLTDKSENIKENENYILIKMKFRIVKSNESAKTSGNRCIAIVNKKEKIVSILYLYHKSFLKKENETIQWKNIIKENYSKYYNFIN
jgi:hypothetical protein